MANDNWRHPANTAVAQVWKGTVTTTTNGHTYTLTLTLDDTSTVAVTYTVANPPDTTVTLVATGIITAWNASTNPWVAQITATQSAGQVILTADTAGIPFSVAASGSGTWSGTGNTTENVGNNDYATPRNWSTDLAPVATNDVILEAGNVGLLYGLSQSSVAIADFRVFPGCSSQIGRFDNGQGFYLIIDPDSLIYEGNGGLVMLNIGSANISPDIAAYGSPSTAGRHALYLKGSNIATALIRQGNVGIGVLDADSCTVATVRTLPLGGQTQFGAGADVTIGRSVSLTTLDHGGGKCLLRCAATTVTCGTGAELTTEGTGAITTVNAYGSLFPKSTGTITTLNAYGLVDFTKDRAAKTVTTLNVFPGARIRVHSGITITNPTYLTQVGSFTLERVG